MKWWAWLLMVPAALLAALVLQVVFSPPMTYADVRTLRIAECVRDKGGGGWRGSSGITLQTYCETRATIELADQFCRENPEKC